MALAIFGITSNALNLVATFMLLGLVAIWIALIVFTFNDARRRIADPFLVACSTAASFFPFIGTIIYTILRPPEFLDDIKEREIELDTSDAQLRQLKATSCGRCGFPVEHDFKRCPSCRTRLKEPCPTCNRPVGLEWKLCPYCETTLIAPKRSSRSGSGGSSKSGGRPEKDKSRRDARSPEVAGPSKHSSGPPSKPASKSARDLPDSSSKREPSSSPREPEDTGQRRSSRSSRRRVVVPEEEAPTTAQKPINSGDTDPTGSGSTPRRKSDNR